MSFNKQIKPANEIAQVRRSAFWHLGQRDHSEKELRDKLARKTQNQQWIDNVIKECFDLGYLNDARFVENIICASQKKGFGISRIKRDLQLKGLTENQPFIDNHYDYIASATALLAGKFKKRIDNQYLKQKAMAFLQNKGHAFDDIFKAIERHNKALPAADEDPLRDAIALLSRKFKRALSDRKMHDKAMRFLLSRGYTLNDAQDAISAHNQQIDEDS